VLVIQSVVQSIAELDSMLAAMIKARYFSRYEQQYCYDKLNPAFSFTGIWCAKQALIIAIASLRQPPSCTIFDIEIRHHANGCPWCHFKDPLLQWYNSTETRIALSISHAGAYAAASVLLDSAAESFTNGIITEMVTPVVYFPFADEAYPLF
jgi:holo-[acyl-carrier protein] synthase